MAKEKPESLSENEIIFSAQASDDYDYWAEANTKVLQKINDLIDNILATPFAGIGKPEPLKFELSGCWSRRINQQHRLVYRIRNRKLEIISCRYHY